MQIQITGKSARYAQPISSQRIPCLRPTSPLLKDVPARPACSAQRSANLQQPLPFQCMPQLEQQRMLVRSRAGSRDNNNNTGGSLLNWFDRLPPKVQLGVMGGLLFIGMFVIPFLQPTFMYGDKSAAQHQVTDARQTTSSEPVKYQLPRYIPVASELYDFLQDNAMPKKLPDGRTESPGVLRIYMSSMIILALFYACSAVVSLILRGVAGVLRAVGVMGPAPPPRPEGEGQQ